MKKYVSIIIVAIVSIAFTSCTDLTEDLQNEHEKQVNELQSTTPGNTGTIDEEDEEETGN